jgi:hypothetical protein
MIVITSQEACKRDSSDFEEIEPYMDSLIAHESIHVVIGWIEGSEISDSLDDIEVIVERNGQKFGAGSCRLVRRKPPGDNQVGEVRPQNPSVELIVPLPSCF